MPTADPIVSTSVRAPDEHPIMFFDGVCNLCNRTVDWTIRRDKRHNIRFAPLQGETAQSLVPEWAGQEHLGSFVLVDAKVTRVRSSAALGLLIHLGGGWAVLGRIGMVIPVPLRDPVYAWIARNRYRWFGRKDSCRLPTESERAQFLP